MKVKELIERVGAEEIPTGRALAYIKDVLSETNIGVARLTVTADKRYYTFPNDMTKLLSVRVKNHLNNKGEYRAIPRLIYQPRIVDSNEPRRGDK